MKPAAPAPVVEATTLRFTRAASCARAARTTWCWIGLQALEARLEPPPTRRRPRRRASGHRRVAGAAGITTGSSVGERERRARPIRPRPCHRPRARRRRASSGMPMSAVPAWARNSGPARLGRAARLPPGSSGPRSRSPVSRSAAVVSSPASTWSSSRWGCRRPCSCSCSPSRASAAVRRPRVAADRRLPGGVVAAKDAVALPEAAGVVVLVRVALDRHDGACGRPPRRCRRGWPRRPR